MASFSSLPPEIHLHILKCVVRNTREIPEKRLEDLVNFVYASPQVARVYLGNRKDLISPIIEEYLDDCFLYALAFVRLKEAYKSSLKEEELLSKWNLWYPIANTRAEFEKQVKRNISLQEWLAVYKVHRKLEEIILVAVHTREMEYIAGLSRETVLQNKGRYSKGALLVLYSTSSNIYLDLIDVSFDWDGSGWALKLDKNVIREMLLRARIEDTGEYDIRLLSAHLTEEFKADMEKIGMQLSLVLLLSVSCYKHQITNQIIQEYFHTYCASYPDLWPVRLYVAEDFDDLHKYFMELDWEKRIVLLRRLFRDHADFWKQLSTQKSPRPEPPARKSMSGAVVNGMRRMARGILRKKAGGKRLPRIIEAIEDIESPAQHHCAFNIRNRILNDPKPNFHRAYPHYPPSPFRES